MSREEETEMSNLLEDRRTEEIRKNTARMHSLGLPSLVGEANALCKQVPLQNTRKKRTYEDTIPQSTRVLRSHFAIHDGEDSEEVPNEQTTENEGDGEEGGQKKKGGRKRTRMHNVYDRLNKPLEPVHYNVKGQPDGDKASELANFISTLVKSHIPLAHADWRQVNISFKTEFMKTLRKFYVVDDELKDWVSGTAHKKWRDFKSYLKEKYFEEEKTDEDLHACRDNRVTIDDWEWLITFWRGEEFQKRSEQGKQNRSKMKVMHTAGSKSYARVAFEMHKENGYAPRRDELFLRTHSRRKDGTPIDRDTAKIISDIEAAIETNLELLEKTIEQGDILTHVLGKERNGYVRCVGMGPNPGRLGIPGGHKLKSTKLQMAEEETKEAWWANDVLREKVEEIREETKSKIEGLMEAIDILKYMMAQTIAANNKTQKIAREPEGSVGESFADEDYNDPNDEDYNDPVDEEERIQQEMRKAKEHFEKKQVEVELLQKKKESELLQKKKESELLQKKKESELLQKKKDAEMHKKQQETMQKKKDAEMLKKQQETMQKKEAATTQKNHQQGKEVILYNIYRDHSTPVAKATILSTDRKKMVGGRELGIECCEVVINYIIKRDAMLPRPIGNVNTMGQAQGRSIAWLYKHMEVDPKSTTKPTSRLNEG